MRQRLVRIVCFRFHLTPPRNDTCSSLRSRAQRERFLPAASVVHDCAFCAPPGREKTNKPFTFFTGAYRGLFRLCHACAFLCMPANRAATNRRGSFGQLLCIFVHGLTPIRGAALPASPGRFDEWPSQVTCGFPAETSRHRYRIGSDVQT